jgi:rhodanese-related sulfurtransferase
LATAVAVLTTAAGARAADAPADAVVASPAKITHVGPDGAAKLIAEGKITVLDLRTPDEFARGHIAGARLLDCQAKDFAQTLGELDKTKTYLVHCASGGRSTQALKQFQKLGFQSVVHLDGGLSAWKRAGKPAAQ